MYIGEDLWRKLKKKQVNEHLQCRFYMARLIKWGNVYFCQILNCFYMKLGGLNNPSFTSKYFGFP